MSSNWLAKLARLLPGTDRLPLTTPDDGFDCDPILILVAAAFTSLRYDEVSNTKLRVQALEASARRAHFPILSSSAKPGNRMPNRTGRESSARP
jgi:hypothetical protein